MDEIKSPVISIQEICELLGVSRNWVNEYVNHYCPEYEGAVKSKSKSYDRKAVAQRLIEIASYHYHMIAIDLIDYTDHPDETLQLYSTFLSNMDKENAQEYLTAVLESLNEKGSKLLTDDAVRFVSGKERRYLPINEPDVIEVFNNEILRKSILTGEKLFYSVKELQSMYGHKYSENVYRMIFHEGTWVSMKLSGRTYFFKYPGYLAHLQENKKIPWFLNKSSESLL